jgi:arylsulfatase A-like enzyme
MTGLYPSQVHQNRNGNETFPENERVRLISRRLSEAGYDCAMAGKLHVASAWKGKEIRTNDGFRRFWLSHSPGAGAAAGDNAYIQWLREEGVDPGDLFSFYNEKEGTYRAYRPDADPRYHQTTWCVDRAIEFIGEEREGPWLMCVNIFEPHPAFAGLDVFRKNYPEEDMPDPLSGPEDCENFERLKEAWFQGKCEPDRKSIKNTISHYYAMIELIDDQLGRLFGYLEKQDLRENTLIIFHSDHGETMGDHGLLAKGCRFYEGLVRIPLIISWPGRVEQNLKSDALVELIDIVPTIAEICGLDPFWMEGKSLLPLLEGRQSPHHHKDYVRTEYYDVLNMFAPYEPEKNTPDWATMYRTRDHKLVVYHNLDYGELYDMQKDPEEYHNLWESDAHQELKAELILESFNASMIITDPGPRRIGRY